MIEPDRFRFYFSFICAILFMAQINAQTENRTVQFDDNWLFFKGGALGAEKETANDAGWRKIDLPHDWSIEDLPHTNSPFDIGAISQVNGGFTTGGTGWYRKHFTIAPQEKGNRFVFQFDGVYMNAEVWVNGKNLAKHPYGYTSFYFDATDRIKIGAENTIVVRVRNEGENSRWYSGSGIYRHVWLKTLNPIHIAQWGTVISTKSINGNTATLNLSSKIFNESAINQPIKIIAHILNVNNKEINKTELTETLNAGANYEFKKEIPINNPELWSVENPKLNKVVMEVFVDDKLIDTETNLFGIRTISFDAENGFQLNNKTVKLKGGCIHNDNGPLGSKAYDRAEERKIELLKASGYNAIRCAHNPPSPALLDACDKLGMLVIDEAFDCWEGGKNPQDYHLYFKDWWQKDVESMVLRDRNHPSIIMWSTGNEIPNRDKPEVVAVAKKLSDYIHQLDSTRAVTCGVNGIDSTKDAFLATLDVAGYNYALDQYELSHQRLPKRVMFSTESFPSASFDYWMGVEDHPYVIGDFVWTAWDYIGEASIGWLGYPQSQRFYPWNLAFCGDIDVCGWKRPQSYYRDAVWKTNQLSLFVKPPKPSFDTATFKKEDWAHWDWQDVVGNWNWKGYENKPLQVEVYSSCEEVELFLNNKSLGRKPTNKSTKMMAIFNVPYAAGELKAIGYSNDKPINNAIIKTADKPVKLKLTADKNVINADGQDLSYITIEVQDNKNNTVPNAENLIQFKIIGGTIVGVANANPTSIESCQMPQRKAWRGKCLVIIKASKKAGDIILTASSNGLQSTSIVFIQNN